MIDNAIPTRAEVTDVANAVYEEVDAVMLSGETTVGKYPLRCIEYLNKVAVSSERTPGLRFSDLLQVPMAKQKLARAAVHLADDVAAAGIIVITRRGKMAQYACSSRPANVPILAFTFNERVRRQLALLRGVSSQCISRHADAEKMVAEAFAHIAAGELGQKGDLFVVISDVLVDDDVDAIQLRRLAV
jgi:pyruvate kinase